MSFPKDFMWGSATASYQIEGSRLEEGRGECIWYRFSHTPGKVVNNDTGDIACDHLHLYPQDIALMKEIGLQTYRFSVSWPRVIPAGIGAINPAGLDFYDKLTDELLKADITPFVTLYHWDLPQALQDKGGWENADSVKWFIDYAELMSQRLGDRVKHWITHNEPWVIAFLGNLMGMHAPGKSDHVAAYRVAHHLLISHGEAVPVIRHNVPDAQVGMTVNLSPAVPNTSSEADQESAMYHDGFQNRWFLDPLYKGVYPADMVEKIGQPLDSIDLSAVQVAAVPTDFLGINYYNRTITSATVYPTFPDDAEFTEMGWEVYPQGLTDILVRVHEDYAPKAIYITENGAAFDDKDFVDGVLEDPRRVAYLEGHFAAAANAIQQGVPLKGYFVWSLMDNFEWAEGYNKRFGIIHVDYATQKRTLKRSALFYKQFIEQMSAS